LARRAASWSPVTQIDVPSAFDKQSSSVIVQVGDQNFVRLSS